MRRGGGKLPSPPAEPEVLSPFAFLIPSLGSALHSPPPVWLKVPPLAAPEAPRCPAPSSLRQRPRWAALLHPALTSRNSSDAGRPAPPWGPGALMLQAPLHSSLARPTPAALGFSAQPGALVPPPLSTTFTRSLDAAVGPAEHPRTSAVRRSALASVGEGPWGDFLLPSAHAGPHPQQTQVQTPQAGMLSCQPGPGPSSRTPTIHPPSPQAAPSAQMGSQLSAFQHPLSLSVDLLQAGDSRPFPPSSLHALAGCGSLWGCRGLDTVHSPQLSGARLCFSPKGPVVPRADTNRVPVTVLTRSLDSRSLRDDLGPGAFGAAVDAIPRPASGSPGAVGHCSRAPHLGLGQEGRPRTGSGGV